MGDGDTCRCKIGVLGRLGIEWGKDIYEEQGFMRDRDTWGMGMHGRQEYREERNIWGRDTWGIGIYER